MIKKIFSLQIVRFAFVGVVNTLVGSAIMFALYNLFNVSYWASSACNYIFGSVLSFFLNKYFTFKNDDKSINQIVRFAFLMIACYLIAYSAAKPLAYALLDSYSVKFKENIAMAFGMCLFTALNFLGQKFLVFDKKGS